MKRERAQEWWLTVGVVFGCVLLLAVLAFPQILDEINQDATLPELARREGVLEPFEFSPAERHMHRNDREVRTTLRVDVAVDARGVVARSYDGMFPGPTIRVSPGSRLVVELENCLQGILNSSSPRNALRWANGTSLHVHGMHVSPEEDDVFSIVRPGESKIYSYEVPRDHPCGTYFYHAHLHGSSILQVGGGMSGALIVSKDVARADDEVIIVFQETNLVQGGARNYAFASRASGSSLPVATKSLREAPLNTSFIVVNGRLLPTLRVLRTQRWRVVNAAIDDVIVVSMPPICSSWVVARDGVSLAAPRRADTASVVLVPGSRVDLVVSCLGTGVVTADPSGIDYLGSAIVARGPLFKVVGENRLDASQPEPDSPQPSSRLFASLLDAAPDRSPFVFQWTQWKLKVRRAEVDYTYYGVNGRDYSPDPIRTITAGDVEEWIILGPRNLTDAHPFHLHTHHFQIISTSTANYEAHIGDWRDTVSVPARGNLTIRFRPLDFAPVTSLAHCHVFSHTDLGMAARYVVIPKRLT